MKNRLDELNLQYHHLVNRGCRRDLSLTERQKVRIALTLVRREQRFIKNQINPRELLNMENAITANEFNHFLYNWSDNVQNFQKFLIHCVGLNAKSPLFVSLVEHINTQNDLDAFIDFYNGGLNQIDLDEALDSMLQAG